MVFKLKMKRKWKKNTKKWSHLNAKFMRKKCKSNENTYKCEHTHIYVQTDNKDTQQRSRMSIQNDE